jgi:hypothetical protein
MYTTDIKNFVKFTDSLWLIGFSGVIKLVIYLSLPLFYIVYVRTINVPINKLINNIYTVYV